MTVDRHLMLQEFTLPPATEKFPRTSSWTIVRVAEGDGYWIQRGTTTRELTVGDVLVAAPNSNGVIRASSLGSLKLQFFSIQPQLLSGLLTVTEWQQLEAANNKISPPAFVFSVKEPLAQKFSRIAEASSQGSLSVRCRFLQLWADAVVNLMPQISLETNYHPPLRERFRQLVGQIPAAEICTRSLSELAGRLGCSERHFRRLFREEFGVPLRTRQMELRLLRAKQFLAESDDKIINVAYDSGYHHLGLFNSSFKKHFGMTPGEWRRRAQKNPAERPRRLAARAGVWLALFGLGFNLTAASAQTNSAPAPVPTATTTNQPPAAANAAPLKFEVARYDVRGNTLLNQKTLDSIVARGEGKEVTFDQIIKTLQDLQTAYRERGFMTVAVTLPKQQLTNAVVIVNVTEAPLVAINIVGNRFFSSENILRALPDVRTNTLLNSYIFQSELDAANANRDRQISPTVGPGPLPGTSALTLRVKDRFPLHARLELNNQSTPNTPDLRLNFNAQYGNLWNREHQIGVQYGFTPSKFKGNPFFEASPFDDPLIANYSAYYRMPIGNPSSVQEQLVASPLNFGYNEATRQFRLPPATIRPTLTFYGSRSTVDTGVQFSPAKTVVNNTNVTVVSQDTGDNLTLNEGVGARLSWPLPQIAGIKPTLSVGLDFKHNQSAGFNTNNFYYTTIFIDQTTGDPIETKTTVSSGQPIRYQEMNYLPLNAGLDLAIPDKLGITSVSLGASFNFSGDSRTHFTSPLWNSTNLMPASYAPTKSDLDYLKYNVALSRQQKIYKDWSVLLRAGGQWTDKSLISNEQFALGGVNSVRGYKEGEVYGDTGWCASIEPHIPAVELGNFTDDGESAPLWFRAWTFVDYGEAYLTDAASGSHKRFQLWGAGIGGMATIGKFFDARLTLAWPLMDTPGTKAGRMGMFFSVGVQF